MTTTLRLLEIVVAICLALLGVFFVWHASIMPAGTVSLPGPGMVPMALGGLLAVVALALALQSGWRRDPDRTGPVRVGHRHILMSFLALAGAGLLFEPIGFIATGTLFLFVHLWTLSPLGWWRSLIAACVAAVASKFVFSELLNVVLPPFPSAL